MKVLYDFQAFEMQRIGGISRYFSILMEKLPDYGINSMLPIIGSNNLYIKGKYDSPIFSFVKNPDRFNRKYTRYLLPFLKYDIVHPTYYNPYILKYKRKSVPMVATVHDFIHERFSSNFPDSEKILRWKKTICSSADRLIAISESTKRDLIDFLGVEENRIDVVYHGIMWNDKLLSQPVVLPFSGEYLLFVGDRSVKYKNFEEFVIGVSPVVRQYSINIVCTGRPFSEPERELLKKYGVDKNACSIMANENELLWLYQNAICFVYPSKYEGFGLPILEAFGAKCPILLSRASCFPEIAGGAAEYYELGSPDSLAASLTAILDDRAKREAMKKAGTERLRFFTLDKMIENTVNVYRKTIG